MSTSDLDLLRRYEPIIRYTYGELFFPMAVDGYLAGCDLLGVDREGRRVLVAKVGDVSVDNLGTWRSHAPDLALYLRFVQRPLNPVEIAENRNRPGRPRFRAPSRLARVGIVARLIDAGFDVSLLVRGTVPGGTVEAAEVKYELIRERDPRYCYYGRVIRQAGWAVCQYLFFYAMNDWRSSFTGANNHEADWEQCFVFLEEGEDGTSTPVWFARAAHDEVGADLRRRWDDPLLLREGDHPIVFAGAGSHAAYIEPGEYLQAVPLILPPRVDNVAKEVRRFWERTVERSIGDSGKTTPIAAVPFVDYARGDGLAIGPGQPETWTPIPVDDDTPWVTGYDGLFGLDTEDRFAGERAPAGPKWTREGETRRSWLDPVAFAGLDATPPPAQLADTLTTEIDALRGQIEGDADAMIELQRTSQRLGMRARAAEQAGRSPAFVTAIATERDRIVEELRELRVRRAASFEAIDDLESELARARSGDQGDPRAHLRHVVHPQDPSQIRLSRVLDVWSAVGVSAAILIAGVLLITNVQGWLGLALIVLVSVAIEALVHRRFLRLCLDVTIILAFVGSLILIASNLELFVAASLLALGVVILRDNVRELRRA
jgi:hypothetical protein